MEVVEKEQSHGRDISSTYIREALHDGNVKLANELLGYRYYVSGIVLHGRQIGRTIGMPTTNLLPPQEKLLPKDGVYLTRTFVKEDEYYGITNVGYKPTVGGETRRGVEMCIRDSRYINRLESELKILGGGNLEYPITIKGNDEITSLAEGITALKNGFLEEQQMKACLLYTSRCV